MEQLPLTKRQKTKLYRQNYRVKKLKEQTGKDACQICSAKLEPGARFIAHHLAYEDEPGGEKITLLCLPCHTWLHGSGVVYRHPFKRDYSKSLAPLIFAQKVVTMYDDAWLFK